MKLQPIEVCEKIVDTVIEHLCGEIQDTPIAIVSKRHSIDVIGGKEFTLQIEIAGEPYLVTARHGG